MFPKTVVSEKHMRQNSPITLRYLILGAWNKGLGGGSGETSRD